jgi:hypothetical protein
MLLLKVTNAGREELHPPRLERALTAVCLRISELGLKPGEIQMKCLGNLYVNGKSAPLKIDAELPPASEALEERVIRQLAKAIGETARHLYLENGWDPRRVEVTMGGTGISWSG